MIDFSYWIMFLPHKKNKNLFCVKNRVSCPWDHPLNHLLFKCYHLNTMLVGGLEHSFFPNSWDDDPIWLSYFSEGLKPPTSMFQCVVFLSLVVLLVWVNQGKMERELMMFVCFFAVKSSLPPAWSLQHHSRRRPHTSAPPLHELGNASLGTGHGASGSLGAVKLLVGYGSTLKTWETIDLRQFLVLMMQWLGYPIWTHCQWKHGHFTTMVIILRRQWMGWSDGGKPCPHRRSSPADSSSSGSWFRTNWPGENQQSTTENWKPETYWKLTGNHWTIDNSPKKYPPLILILWKWPKIPPPPKKNGSSCHRPDEASQISWQTAGAALLPGPLDSGWPAFVSPWAWWCARDLRQIGWTMWENP